jgi:hypothetical protein
VNAGTGTETNARTGAEGVVVATGEGAGTATDWQASAVSTPAGASHPSRGEATPFVR